MEGQIWNIGDTSNTSDSHSVCSTVKSRDSLVQFSEIKYHQPRTLKKKH